jgi:hypothetical protein
MRGRDASDDPERRLRSLQGEDELMDVIVAAFDEATEATAAANDLGSQLMIGEDSIAVDPVPDRPAGSVNAHPLPGEAVLVAYVRDDARARARDVIGRHGGRHLPLDWLNAMQEEVDPGTVPDT